MTVQAFLLTLGMVLCYTGQGFFNKLFSLSHPGKPSEIVPVFSVIYGLIVASSTFLYAGFRFSPDAATLIYGVLNGIILFLYNDSCVHAAKSGPYTLQSMLSTFGSIVLPLVFSLTLWGETLSPIRLVGILLMLCSVLIYNLGGLGSLSKPGFRFRWFLLVFLSNGIYCILTAAQQKAARGAFRNDMIITTFLTSAVVSALCMLIPDNRAAVRAFRMPAKARLFALSSSICAAVAIHLLMLTLRLVPVAILYPTQSGGVFLFSALLSVLVLRERPERRQIIAILLALPALVLTNL